jgi:ribosomal protein S18 acetylase RimI-like enzyme
MISRVKSSFRAGTGNGDALLAASRRLSARTGLAQSRTAHSISLALVVNRNPYDRIPPVDSRRSIAEDIESVELKFRETRLTDVDALFEIRGRTRQNPLTREALAQLGITPRSTERELTAGNIWGAVCMHNTRIVGFCTGEVHTGEILVLAVLPDYEGHGVGKQLLSRVVDRLQAAGAERIWLVASADPTVRAHGFYRALGWKPNGQRMINGDEILELYRGTP